MKTLDYYWRSVFACERLHLLTQVSLGFPNGEKASLEIPAAGVPTACWSFDKSSGHSIKIGNTLTSHLKVGRSGSPTPNVVLKGTKLAYQHERCHALYTSRDFKRVSTTCKAEGIPFRLWNLFEDIRIEYKAGRTMSLPFKWQDCMAISAPPPGGVEDQMGPVAFALTVKQFLGSLNAWDIEQKAKRPFFIRRNVKLLTRANIFNRGPWKGAGGIVPNGCTGNYRQGLDLILDEVAREEGAINTLSLIAPLKRWLELFPMPEDEKGKEPGEGMPGETAVGGVSDEAATGPDTTPAEGDGTDANGTPDTSSVKKGTFADETIDSPAKTAKVERELREAKTGSEPNADPGRDKHGPYIPTAGNVEGLPTVGKPFDIIREPTPGCISAYDRTRGHVPDWNTRPLWAKNAGPPDDLDGTDSANRMRDALPGTNGQRWTTDATDDVSIDRYLDRTAEMFSDNKADIGGKADLILIIDGSSSMQYAWYNYGLSITHGLIRLRDQGIVKRLRLIVTDPYSVLMIEHPTAEHAQRIEPGAGSEGLWAAYEAIVSEGWIDGPGIQCLTLTDGDITDTKPRKRVLHAAGVFPVGAYVAINHAVAAAKLEKVAEYFDSYMARVSRSALLDDIARLF